jgi:glycosyltransferase involved in cell wall biosynthesis
VTDRPTPRLVSVIVPCRDASPLLVRQLECLARQDYRGAWEVIVADNGPDQQASGLVEQFAARVPCVSTVDASGRIGASAARNAGARAAAGDLLVFCDADDEVDRSWLSQLTSASAGHDLVGGSIEESALNARTGGARREPMGVTEGLIRLGGFLPFAVGGNCAIWADVFASIGGWNEEYPRANDVEFSWRAQLLGYTIGFAPRAVVHYRHRAGRTALLRQFYGWGRADAQLYRDFRSYGFRRPADGGLLRTWWRLCKRLIGLRTRNHRDIWLVDTARAVGRLAGSVRWRVYFP